MDGDIDALVIGAGISGLTTAITLAEVGRRVRIWSAAPTAETTSTLASAMVGPNFAPPGDRLRDWQRETVTRLTASPSTPGVAIRDGLLVARPAGPPPPYADEAPGFRPADPEEMPAGYGTGFWVRLPLVDMPVYLDHLVDRFGAAGGEIQLRTVDTLAEAVAACPRVVNCTGLAARTLAPDPAVHPVRGPKIIVENPGLDSFFMEAPVGPVFFSYFPHGDHIVLGGMRAHSDDTTPDPAEAAEITRRVAEIEPRLAGARILEHRVGLRPGRDQPRVEAERSGDAVVVHNYGHDGSGVMLSWGCARDAAALLFPDHPTA